MGKKKFTAIALDLEHKTFVVHTVSLGFPPLTNTNVYLSCRPQITSLIAKKTLIKISVKYVNFIGVFSSNLASKLLKHTGINNYTIKLINSQ